ncbi:MAG: DHHA1 domain-containing protein, partial [Propionibacteriaceae bacterium]|nr:DHHA1 domain-containing protein [Propionibacteriaceae bacterium]
DLKGAQVAAAASGLVSAGVDLGRARFIGAVDPAPGTDLRALAMDVRARLGSASAVVCLIGTSPKPAVVVATTAAARDNGYKAGALVALAATALGGRGGGSDDLAQGGGVDPLAAQVALEAVATALA